MLIASPTEARQCAECGLHYARAETSLWGRAACICASCYTDVKNRYTEHRLSLYMELGFRKDASTYTESYIKNLPREFRREAEELYKKYLQRRIARRTPVLIGEGA